MIGIYYIKNNITNQYYVGQSCNLKKRLRDHKNNLRNNVHHNKHLQSSWNKYGENFFDFFIICFCDKKMLNPLEEYYISFFNSFNEGFNKTSGGDNIPIELSISKTGKNNPFYGKKHSKESKKKMSKAKKGKKLKKDHCMKIKESLTGKRHSLDRQINESLGQNTTGYFRVSKHIAHSTKTGYSYRYSYYDDDGKRIMINSTNLKKLEEKVKSKGL